MLDHYKISIHKDSHIENNTNLYESTSSALKGQKGDRYGYHSCLIS